MHRLRMQSQTIFLVFQTQGRYIRQSTVNATESAAVGSAAQRQKSVQLNTNDKIAALIKQPQVAASTDALRRAESISVLDPTSTRMTQDPCEIPATKILPRVAADKAPLSFEEIPGPAILKLWEKYWKYVPFLGRLSWNRNVTPLSYLFNEYGCIVRIHGPLSGDIVMIHRPEHIAEVLKQEGHTPIRSGIDVLQHYHLNHRKYRLAGPFSLQGTEWLEFKEKVDKPFEEIISSFFGRVEMICDEFCSKIRRIRNRQDEVPSNFHQDLVRWGMECFGLLMFNKRLGFLEFTELSSSSEPARIIEALSTAHTYLSRCETGFQVWRFFETPFSKKLFTACDVIDSMIGKYVRQTQNALRYRSSNDANIVMTEEISPILEKLFLSQRVNADDISTLLLDMIILGVQATANCQAFLLYFLAKNPRVQRKLFEEISSLWPNCETALTEDNLKDMIYLKACLKESLRLRPAFPYMTRLLPETISLHGYTIPKGTFVIMATQITSQREENFEDPEKFRPERWLISSDSENPSHEYSCLPFGYGIRSCLGKNMAETEILLLTAKLVREFRIEYDYADIESKFMMVNVPNKPLRFRFVDRD